MTEDRGQTSVHVHVGDMWPWLLMGELETIIRCIHPWKLDIGSIITSENWGNRGNRWTKTGELVEKVE